MSIKKILDFFDTYYSPTILVQKKHLKLSLLKMTILDMFFEQIGNCFSVQVV